MNFAVDYSSLPVRRPLIPTRTKPQLLLVLLAVLLIVTRSLTTFKQHLLNNILLGLIPFIIVVLLAFRLRIHHDLSEQARRRQEAVQMFAERNGWQFEGPKTLDHLPLPSQTAPGGPIQQLYCIAGVMRGQSFELTAAGNQTVLRSRGPLNLTLTAVGMQTASDNDWNYMYMSGIATTVDDMKALLLPLLGAPAS